MVFRAGDRALRLIAETHDRYWVLFVTPMMIVFTVGVVALPMLLWSLIPRRDDRPLDV